MIVWVHKMERKKKIVVELLVFFYEIVSNSDQKSKKSGGGFRIGNTCTPVVDSCQCIAKPIQYCKVK